VILIGEGRRRAAEIVHELARQLKSHPKPQAARASIRRNGYIICAQTSAQAVEICNLKAPEHVEIMTRDARTLSKKVTNAGAIFIGPMTPEAVGDYIAGPNHTLPTGGTARFFSPLSVWSFYKTCHAIEADEAGLARYASTIETLAEAEGLPAHAATIRIRGALSAKTGDRADAPYFKPHQASPRHSPVCQPGRPDQSSPNRV
jgi:histidinol dehydrogenase